jgi:hypothetical protein
VPLFGNGHKIAQLTHIHDIPLKVWRLLSA